MLPNLSDGGSWFLLPIRSFDGRFVFQRHRSASSTKAPLRRRDRHRCPLFSLRTHRSRARRGTDRKPLDVLCDTRTRRGDDLLPFHRDSVSDDRVEFSISILGSKGHRNGFETVSKGKPQVPEPRFDELRAGAAEPSRSPSNSVSSCICRRGSQGGFNPDGWRGISRRAPVGRQDGIPFWTESRPRGTKTSEDVDPGSEFARVRERFANSYVDQKVLWRNFRDVVGDLVMVHVPRGPRTTCRRPRDDLKGSRRERVPPPPGGVQCIVIGAGAAGLAAAQTLSQSGVSVIVLEGRLRIGGRIHTVWLPKRELPNGSVLDAVAVDLGANYLHGCDDEQPVFDIAVREGIRAPVVAGGAHAESTSCAKWFDTNTGQAIPWELIADMHHLCWSAADHMVELANGLECYEEDMDVESAFQEGLMYVLRNLGNRKLTMLESQILESIRGRAWGYVSMLCETSLRLQKGVRNGLRDNRGYCSQHNIKREARKMRDNVSRSRSPSVLPASRLNGKGDRLVVDGYHGLLIDKLSSGIKIELGKVVHSVYLEQDSCVVKTRDGKKYHSRFVISTVPISVLQGVHEQTCISFHPALSKEKRDAVDRMKMGVHNKVILRFAPNEVFWPSDIPQINCSDPRFNFLNLHAYGKQGVLLCHVFGYSAFAHGWFGQSDDEVVEQTIQCLHGMFPGTSARPVDYVVTHWDVDPFSMGSYSFMPKGSRLWDDVKKVRMPHPPGPSERHRLFFAGEATSIEGWQCVHGAYETGIKAAHAVITRLLFWEPG